MSYEVDEFGMIHRKNVSEYKREPVEELLDLYKQMTTDFSFLPQDIEKPDGLTYYSRNNIDLAEKNLDKFKQISKANDINSIQYNNDILLAIDLIDLFEKNIAFSKEVHAKLNSKQE